MGQARIRNGMKARLPRVRPGIVFTLLVALTACSSSSQSTAQQTPAAEPAAPAALRWSPCRDVPNTQCAGLPVPVDPAKPDGAKFTLRIARVPAIDTSRTKGVLIFLPGGPGAGIVQVIGGNSRKEQHVDELRREYDVVTFDPRGIGESDPVRCAPDAVPSPKPPTGRAMTADEFKALADENAALFKSCYALTGDLFRHLSAMDTAADVEQMRLALTPNDGLIAYGGSYGSHYGQAYLERYPNHVKAMVLDAVIDHSIDLPTAAARNVTSVADSFDRFARWCEGDVSCALHGQGAGAVYDSVTTKMPETRILISQFLSAGSDPDFGWPAIAKMMDEVNRGDTSVLKSLTGTGAAATASTSEDPNLRAGKNGLFPGVFCADYGAQNDYNAVLPVANALTVQAPRFVWKFWDAYPIAHASLGVPDCAGWPWAASNPPHKLVVGSHPNVMVMSPAYDPATPLVNALAVWLQIPQARLLIADVDGHQAWILSRCAFDAARRFLDDPSSTQRTTLCAK
jgi:pimeloyl-ACP methyl ester carboxylesterase